MYWLISGLILVVMMSVLAVVDTLVLPQLVVLTTYRCFMPIFLMLVTSTLIAIQQRKTLPIQSMSVTTKQDLYSLLSYKMFGRIAYHLSIITLALILIVGSLLQALIHHQYGEVKKIVSPMRVQAVVTIEGISDSVYDVASNSGYRQVAIINDIKPLVTELTRKDLDDRMTDLLTMSDSIDLAMNNTNRIDSINQQNNEVINRRVLLRLYSKKPDDNISIDTINNLQPGDQLLMTLSLKPLLSAEQITNNPTGFDSYRWLRARHIDGVADILAVSSVISNVDSQNLIAHNRTFWQRMRITIDQVRLQLRQHFYQDRSTKTLDEQQAQAVTLSLLTGDRSLINRETKDLYQLAGISHLLAISGTHVLFLAIVLAAMVTTFIKRTYPALYRTVPRWRVRWWVMIVSAFIYALFTGFDVPAARTAWMLIAIGLVRSSLLPVSTVRVLVALAILMAWFDPYVLWQAGFWLSFVAVGLLLKYDSRYEDQKNPITAFDKPTSVVRTTVIDKIWLVFRRIFRLQFWLFIALLPITLLLFGKASLWGLIINLFAIGLFGWIIVPLNLLAGLCYWLSPTIATSIWSLVSYIVENLHELISWVTGLSMLRQAWLYTPINLAILLMSALVVLPWLLPRGLLNKGLALVPLSLLVMTVYANQRALLITPILYILPTGDRNLSAVVLHYPIDKIGSNNANATNKSLSSTQNSVSWLLLADHRVQGTRAMPSRLTDQKLAAILEQQLRTLSIKHLDGLIVQTGSAFLTNTLTNDTELNEVKSDLNQAATLLSVTVAKLSQTLPIYQYWQAGRHDRGDRSLNSQQTQQQVAGKITVSTQDCQQDKIWHSINQEITLQALTGWSEIDDARVWDCSIAITSQKPITVVHYNAANPQQPSTATMQDLRSDDNSTDQNKSRLIIEAATHKHSWQLWSLLCQAQPFVSNSNNASSSFMTTKWLTHSQSLVSVDVLQKQQVSHMISFDNQPLEVALSLVSESSAYEYSK